MSKRKPNGFYSRMTREQLSECISSNYPGLSLGELSDKNASVYNLASQSKTSDGKNLLDELVERGVLLRLSRPKNYWQDITTEQLREDIKKGYDGKPLTWFARRDRCMYNAALERKLSDGKSLIDELVEQNVLVRATKPDGFFKNMTDEQMINYVDKNFHGFSVSELSKTAGSVYNAVREREFDQSTELIDEIVRRGILTRVGRPKKFFVRMTNEQLGSYIESNYKGMSITKLQKTDSSAYANARQREVSEEKNLIDELVERGVLIRPIKPKGYWKNMTDEQLISHIDRNHHGKTISAFNKEEGSCYQVAAARDISAGRKLIDEIVERGILVRTGRHHDFAGMTNEELIGFVDKNYHGSTITAFEKDNSYLCKILRDRKIIREIVKRGILASRYKERKSSNITSLLEDIASAGETP